MCLVGIWAGCFVLGVVSLMCYVEFFNDASENVKRRQKIYIIVKREIMWWFLTWDQKKKLPRGRRWNYVTRGFWLYTRFCGMEAKWVFLASFWVSSPPHLFLSARFWSQSIVWEAAIWMRGEVQWCACCGHSALRCVVTVRFQCENALFKVLKPTKFYPLPKALN